ncbi:transporter associated domain-containing protein [Corallococcus sp. CA053C]|uniref:transporter associated domain-containing protein n=1 Tax=Corallococcus sp. CA053C TaxID=2316732 RepID=UPI0018F5CA7E|nr:transporter associated domain-containing protein [Corallococcus sp. CA053C]
MDPCTDTFLGGELGLDLTHDEVDTVSGLVLAKLGRPPRVGDKVEHAEALFEVTVVEGHGVKGCRIQRLPPSAVTAPEEGVAPPA